MRCSPPLLLLALVCAACARRDAGAPAGALESRPPVAVEVLPVETGAITLRRSLTGTLEPTAELTVAPKVGGRIARVLVDLGDTVRRGQTVALLDDAEFVQAARQAEADLAAARAALVEAESALAVAERGLERVRSLRREGLSSESQLDAALAEQQVGAAGVEVAKAGVTAAEARREAAEIRLGYAEVVADWHGGDDERTVAARFADEGNTVAQAEPLLTVVELDPVLAVVAVPERDYGLFSPGIPVRLRTDAHPGRTFGGRVARIAPVFRSSTRQARTEIEVENPDEALKPGMFVRAELELAHVERTTIVPYVALVERADEQGVFRVIEDGSRVEWVPVEVGVREGPRQEVRGDGVSGRVVTVGQALCDDGSAVRIVDVPDTAGAPGTPAR